MSLSERAKNILNFLNGFRKFTIMMILIVIGITFRLADLLSGEEMVNLLQATAVAFMSANTVEHMLKGVKHWVEKKNA